MMRKKEMLWEIALFLLIVNLGIACGAGLYESQITFPQWLVETETGERVWNADAARSADVGLGFWVYVTTVPMTLLLIVNGVGAWKCLERTRGWWLAAVILLTLERLGTFGYFIPAMIQLMAEDPSLAPELAVRNASRWELLNTGRHLLSFAAWFSALIAWRIMGSEGREEFKAKSFGS
ncbi:MAG: DUF1772 domain-containing protein [Verrucomicrobia bacterium]|nr:DUF1772 domain-containing protein [Verrucomicrobiota bacterium]